MQNGIKQRLALVPIRLGGDLVGFVPLNNPTREQEQCASILIDCEVDERVGITLAVVKNRYGSAKLKSRS